MKLVIAEKPSVANSLAAVLGATTRRDGYLEGGGWLVSWCLGHLAGLADASVYNPDYAKWRYDDLPILPETWRFTISKDKREQFDVLRTLLRREDVTEVVNACDAGREGELIFRTVYCLAGCTKPMKRLWISSMEDSAIREGFANLRPGADYDGLHQAALCRAKADWLVGINATRLFSVLYHRTLNIGRVMSPTLALIVQREAEIDAFKPVPFYVRDCFRHPHFANAAFCFWGFQHDHGAGIFQIHCAGELLDDLFFSQNSERVLTHTHQLFLHT